MPRTLKPLIARQEAKLNSFRSTEQHVDANIAVINDIPAFLAVYNKIKANIVRITEAAEEKAASLTGIAGDKSGARETLVKKAAVIAGLVYSYAAANDDQTLLQEMNLTESKIRRTRDDELAPLCRMIHNRAETNLDALKDYNLNAAKLTDMQTSIDTYAAEAPKPRTAISNRKTTNINIGEIVRATDKLFENQFDKQIESLTDEHPDFVNTYKSTREFVNPPSRKRKPKVTSGNNPE